MKTGRTIQNLAEEVDRQAKSKRDFLASTDSLTLLHVGKLQIKGIEGENTFDITDHCHAQIAERLSIPARYYQRMLAEAPMLLSTNVNWWLTKNTENRMVRTLDNRARAFLSDRYRPLDNYDLCEAVLPKISELECEVASCEITETRLYIKVVTKRIQAEVSVGDVVNAGLCISNSEVGCSSVRVEPLIYRLRCKNGLIAADSSIKKYHIGKSGDVELEGAAQFFRTETRIADDRAFWMKVQDVVAAAVDQVSFEKIVDKMRIAKDRKIEGHPEKVVELVAKQNGFTNNEQGSVLRHLIDGGDLNAYGLANAITRTSQDIENYDRATDFERLGGKVIELAESDWKVLAA